MSTFASPTAHTTLEDDDEGSLLLLDVGLRLRRRADRKIAHALLVGRDQLAGVPDREIRDRYGLDRSELDRARRWLMEAGAFEPGVEGRLKATANRHIRLVLEIGQDLIDGHTPAEIRERHGLSPRDYRQAVGWLQGAIRRTPRD